MKTRIVYDFPEQSVVLESEGEIKMERVQDFIHFYERVKEVKHFLFIPFVDYPERSLMCIKQDLIKSIKSVDD